MKKHLGVFIAGYRWSGSGAVSDWLAGHDGFCRVEGSEAAFGEIRALNYGLKYLVQTAAERIRYGERLGRWALCPDPRLWDQVLGKALTLDRRKAPLLYALIDFVYYNAAKFHVIPAVTKYREMLDYQLGMDFREDKEYLAIVDGLVRSLRDFMKNSDIPGNPEDNEDVKLAASALLSFFLCRLGQEEKVLIYDNAISGMNPELFHLLHPDYFPGQIIILVRRDPRDQFAELVKYSGSTFSWNPGHFIHQYRNVQERTKRFLERINLEDEKDSGEVRQKPERFIRQVTFGSFVLDRNGVRTNLKNDLENFWEPFGLEVQAEWKTGNPDEPVEDGMNRLFNPDSSSANIGIWRKAGLDRQMERISEELGEYIEE